MTTTFIIFTITFFSIMPLDVIHLVTTLANFTNYIHEIYTTSSILLQLEYFKHIINNLYCICLLGYPYNKHMNQVDSHTQHTRANHN